MSDSVQPHRRQPTRLPCAWDSPGENTGVGCHFLLQCMKVKSESEVTQWYPTLSNPMDCSLPGSSVHGIFQARVLNNSLFHREDIQSLGSWGDNINTRLALACCFQSLSILRRWLRVSDLASSWTLSPSFPHIQGQLILLTGSIQ